MSKTFDWLPALQSPTSKSKTFSLATKLAQVASL